VSFDKCCDGAKSTYRTMVGRSKSVTGPYVDKSGKSMMSGGGTQVVAGDGRWKGPGHNAVFSDKGKWYNVYHAYAASNGAAELRITEMAFDGDGWPIPHAP
jgi:arabinan endo-1,5-alpha-L-arabinosidase